VKKKKMEKRMKSTNDSRISTRSRPWASTTSHLMVSSRTLSSHYLGINPQNLNLSFSLCMDESWGLLGVCHPKGKNQICYNSILSRLSLDILSFGFLDVLHEMMESLSSLEARMSRVGSLILVTRNSPKPQAKLSCSISSSQSFLGFWVAWGITICTS
jgi:hypothetical protein